jgi:hypothetical protein
VQHRALTCRNNANNLQLDPSSETAYVRRADTDRVLDGEGEKRS